MSPAKLIKKNIQDILALTPMQEGMLYHYLKEITGSGKLFADKPESKIIWLVRDSARTKG